jgi:hypothetical protein
MPDKNNKIGDIDIKKARKIVLDAIGERKKQKAHLGGLVSTTRNRVLKNNGKGAIKRQKRIGSIKKDKITTKKFIALKPLKDSYLHANHAKHQVISKLKKVKIALKAENTAVDIMIYTFLIVILLLIIFLLFFYL